MNAPGLTGGDRLRDHLEKIKQKLGTGELLRVGFLEGSTYPDGTPTALVAAVNEFGDPANNQPPRPYFRHMIEAKSPGWGAVMAKNLKDTDYDGNATLARMGEGIEGQLQQSIRDLTSPPLAKSTILARAAGSKRGDVSPTISPSRLSRPATWSTASISRSLRTVTTMDESSARKSPAATGLRDRTHNTSALNPITGVSQAHGIAAKLRDRLADHINEHRLRHASRAYLAAATRGDRSGQVAAWTRYSALHAKRSPACIARLEAQLGIRLRRTIKRQLMTAFLHGALPGRFVTVAFRIFGLREA